LLTPFVISAQVNDAGLWASVSIEKKITKDFSELADGLFQVSEELADHIQHTLTTEVEPQLTEWLDPILEAYLGFEVTVEEAIQPMMHTVEPMLNNHSACVGCRHYHGQEYGGNLLVCGMHPYGWESETCPDWESSWKMPPDDQV
jgi:hypothetical protein